MVWLVGNRGMLGADVEELLRKGEFTYVATDIDLDITDRRLVQAFVCREQPSWIINCAAYTDVDKAEDEENVANKINVQGVRNLGLAADLVNAAVVHISTDYVFDGESDSAYCETDTTNPIGAYGRTKLEGEAALCKVTSRCFIVRTAWMFGIHGSNFVATMLRRFKEQSEVRVIADQRGSPTFSRDLAEFVLHLVRNNADQYGIYHYTNEGMTTWFDFATAIYINAVERKLVKHRVAIVPTTTEQYPTRARRPRNSVLSKDKIKSTFNVTILPWEDALGRYLDRIADKRSI